jgi:hypothetical protein
MMTILSAIFTALGGRLFSAVTVPLLCLGLLTTTHQLWKARDGRLMDIGEKRCDARWEEQIRTQERAAVAQDMKAARQMIVSEQEVTRGLRDELDKVGKKMDLLRSGGSSGNCLSDGVLEELKRREGGGNGSARPKPTS